MNGLFLYRSDSIEYLAHLLIAQLSDPENLPHNPATALAISVGSKGMERWLRHTIAEHLGICANIKFPFPTAAVQNRLKEVYDSETGSCWTPLVVALAAIDTLFSNPDKFPDFARYASDIEGEIKAKQVRLASEVANTYDAYVAYRPQMCDRWNQNHLTEPIDKVSAWQPALWSTLVDRLGVNCVNQVAELSAFAKEEPTPKANLTTLRLFGVSTLTPLLLEQIKLIARSSRVEIYLLTPSDKYWADARRSKISLLELNNVLPFDEHTTHPLLGSLGRAAGHLQASMTCHLEGLAQHEIGQQQLDIFSNRSSKNSDSALSKFQDDILNGRSMHEVGERVCNNQRLIATDDHSLQIHSTSGAMRQVEALQQALLSLFDQYEGLQPRDVVVMTPNIERYAPLATSIFSATHKDASSTSPHIPLRVGDLSLRRLNPVADAILRLLDLAGSRLTFSGLTDLLAVEPVALRFAFDDEQIKSVTAWLAEAGMRWGLDKAERVRNGLPDDSQNSLEFALNRISLGLALSGQGQLWLSTAPYDKVEGADTNLLIKLLNFCQVVEDAIKEFSNAKTVSDWSQMLLGVDDEPGFIERLTLTEGKSIWLTSRARRAVLELKMAAETAGASSHYTTGGFNALLSERFNVADGAGQQSGAVTLCALKPERSIPYKVVALLGFDDGEFPRKNLRNGFDLTAIHPRRGDRNPSDEDRLLFLEAALAAQNHLLIFYTGHNIKENAKQPPCVPVAEFITILQRSFDWTNGQLIYQHPLQPYSPSIYSENAGYLHSYNASLLKGAVATQTHQSTSPPFWPKDYSITNKNEPSRVSIDELARWLREPNKQLLRSTLGIFLSRFFDNADDELPVKLSNLDRAIIPKRLLRLALDGTSLEHESKLLAASGSLPPGDAGRHQLDELIEVTQGICEELSDYGFTACTDLELSVPIEGLELYGTVSLFNDYHIETFPSKDASTYKEILPGWLRHLLLQVQDPERDHPSLLLYGTMKGGEFKQQWRRLKIDDSAKALDLLKRIVSIYKQAQCSPTPLFSGASIKAGAKLKTGFESADLTAPLGHLCTEKQTSLLRAAKSTAIKKYTDPRGGDLNSPELRLLFPYTDFFEPDEGDPLLPEHSFINLAFNVWGELIASRKTFSKGPKL